MKPIAVALADDHGIVRAGLRALIDAEQDMKVVGEADSGFEAIMIVKKLAPSVVVLDISMPGMSGIKVAEQLRDEAPETRVLMLTMHDDAAFVRAATAVGCAGYVVKKAIGTELVTAIRAVHGGRTYLNVSLPARGLGAVLEGGEAVDARTARLSAREREVLGYLALGHTNQQIAEKLHVSGKTVGTYRARLAEKLGLRTRADIVRFAIETKMLAAADRT